MEDSFFVGNSFFCFLGRGVFLFILEIIVITLDLTVRTKEDQVSKENLHHYLSQYLLQNGKRETAAERIGDCRPLEYARKPLNTTPAAKDKKADKASASQGYSYNYFLKYKDGLEMAVPLMVVPFATHMVAAGDAQALKMVPVPDRPAMPEKNPKLVKAGHVDEAEALVKKQLKSFDLKTKMNYAVGADAAVWRSRDNDAGLFIVPQILSGTVAIGTIVAHHGDDASLGIGVAAVVGGAVAGFALQKGKDYLQKALASRNLDELGKVEDFAELKALQQALKFLKKDIIKDNLVDKKLKAAVQERKAVEEKRANPPKPEEYTITQAALVKRMKAWGGAR